MRASKLRLAGSLCCALGFNAAIGSAQDCSGRVVSRAEIIEAMRQHGPYNLAATSNAGRLGAETFLRLAVAQRATAAPDSPLIVRQADWYAAFLEVSGLPPDRVPIGTRLAYEHEQDMRIEHNYNAIIKQVIKGAAPRMALNVRIAWEPRPGRPERYSYRDSSAVPQLEVTSEREVHYRLLDYGDVVMYEEMRGVAGRPTTGLLGALFGVIGKGRVVNARLAFAPDGTQVLRGRARKVFEVSTTATFTADGRGDKGIPTGRADLHALEARLKQDLEIEYYPHRC